ncbi:MAG: hypothetical protein QXW47_00175 [Candidatus Jordarchaeales archaeon]|nr:hypothetical protein [Candidatus Jordarchaeia archaeon]
MISWENVGDDEELKELNALKKFVTGDYVKIAILEQLVKGGWCTLSELCRAARGYDRYVGHVRVSTILQYMESIAKGILEKAENEFSVKWRIRPEKKKDIEGWIGEIKSTPYRKSF